MFAVSTSGVSFTHYDGELIMRMIIMGFLSSMHSHYLSS